ncbi:Na(+)/H(+) antiporter subunit D [Chromatiales bacterium (ex Bugula neritina AB1)]|nr:Na(+)/H(+) antiporter subunit D [Chromatiales bacterium (ex Bugula neritina AB1)]
MTSLNPALLFLVVGILLPLLPAASRRYCVLFVPLLGMLLLCLTPYGNYGQASIFGLPLESYRLDKLAFVWALIFHIAAVIGAIYAFHLKDPIQQVAALIYQGAAIGAVLAGDLLTLFVWWELTAIASVFLIWARRTNRAYRVGMRYLIIQVGSGVILLTGVLLQLHTTGSLAFEHIGLGSVASWFIFISFGIKCAFPLLHNWLQDAYPEATVTGTVILSAFTTKLAVYALARGFAGTEILIWIGAIMTAFPILFAVIENDLRRVLSYSLNNQLGFMVVGVGIGTELSLNGTAAHAFSHILYKALLFMAMGAVLYRVKTIKASELGGLYKSMPWTTVFCIIGSMSISAFPLFSGFISKSMILTAVAEQHYTWVWLILLLASAGVMDHSGIKIPFFAFFAHDSGKRCKEAPTNMLIAMGIASFLCIAIGVYPQSLYAILPYPVDYAPYTTTHVITQLQLLMFSALAFTVLFISGRYPPEIKSTNLDTDWFYRVAAVSALTPLITAVQKTTATLFGSTDRLAQYSVNRVTDWLGPRAWLSKTLDSTGMVALVVGSLMVFLLFYML